MIRTEREYQEAVKRLQQSRELAARQRAALEELGLSVDEVKRGMEPALSFQAELEEEVAWYERVMQGEIEPIRRLTEMGRVLIALRITRGITQAELARRMNVSEAQVSRDERNEYHGISVDRAQAILDALEATVLTQVEASTADEPHRKLAGVG